jgi:hypothetical protein|tara:strand:+ start:572 stop:703 length:132 start_codon:yes stop_codon:yes gene_type:complete
MILEKLNKKTDNIDSFSKLLQKAEIEYENYIRKKYIELLNSVD